MAHGETLIGDPTHRLNHELSVQLSKELPGQKDFIQACAEFLYLPGASQQPRFNLRAAALKRAGEEIVTLRRHVASKRAWPARWRQHAAGN